jgi:hypothetical protein
MPIAPLPALDRTSATFKTDVDAFFGSSLPAFSVQAEAARAAIVASEAAAVAAAGTATTKAGEASTSAGNASTSATTATTKAGEAVTSAGLANTKAGEASTSAATATTKAGEAAASATNAEASRLSADKRYLGAKASAPTLDNQGAALQAGAWYYDTTLSNSYIWNGSAWAVFSGTYQIVLVSGTNIKTVGGVSLLGSGNISAGGLTNFTESANTAAPNATVPVVQLLATNAAGQVDVALSPKGGGALSAQVPDDLSSGGAKRGTRAVDWQSLRGASTQVASGNSAVITGGDLNTASATSATVNGGSGNVADGNYSSAAGQNATTRGIRAASVWGQGSASGTHQTGAYLLKRDTTDATATVLATSAAAASSANTVCLANNAAYYLRVRVVARNTTSGVSKSWLSSVLMTRGANAASTAIIGTPTVTSDFGDASLAAASIALTADTTIGGLAVTVTGIAATNLRWLAHVETLETTN